MIKKAVLIYTILLVSYPVFANDKCSANLKKNELKNYHYVIVPGILNEIISHYMTEYRRFLILNEVPVSQIHRVNLSSLSKPDDAAEEIKNLLKDVPKNKEFIFIAHSKGSLESLYFLKNHSKTLKLKKAIFIQGSLDGSSITKLPDVEGFSKVVKFLIKRMEKIEFIKNYKESYSSSHVRKNLSDLYEHPDLLEKILFIESETTYEKLQDKFKPLGAQYLNFFGSVGDGVLLGSDHIPYVLKNDPLICRWEYAVDHSALVKAAPWSRFRVEKIRKFMRRALLGSEGD